jgi:hypothetical protein
MPLKKIYLRPSYLVVMWYILFFVSIMTITLPIAFIKNIYRFHRHSGIDLIVDAVSTVLILFIAWVLWRKATFAKKDFIKLAYDLGVRFIKKRTKISPRYFGKYRFAYGWIDDIHVAAIILSPFFSYFPGETSLGIDLSKREDVSAVSGTPRSNQTSWEKFQAYMFAGRKGGPGRQESQVELFSLIKGPYSIDVIVKCEDGKDESPVTGCPEIDEAIKNHLSGAAYFNARLIFNKDCLRMTIIGGSWEGKRFGDKIQNSFEMFKQMNAALKTKYPVASWDKYQVKWNRSEETFYLAGQ